MASNEQQGASGSAGGLNLFTSGIEKDLDTLFKQTNVWSYARNAVNFIPISGEYGTISNEPSTKLCTTIYIDGKEATIVGLIYLMDDKWCVFSTLNENPEDGDWNEIGIFDKSLCTYVPVLRSKCLAFSPHFPITGVSKRTGQCEYKVYWADGYNYDRYIDLGNADLWPQDPISRGDVFNVPWLNSIYSLPYKTNDDISTDCYDYIPIYPLDIDCNKLRLNPTFDLPQVVSKRGKYGGTLADGVYFAAIAFKDEQNILTDYFISQPAFIYGSNNGASLDVEINNINNRTFQHFSLVVISIINGQTVVKEIGTYAINSTRGRQRISVTYIPVEAPNIPLEQVLKSNLVYPRSKRISSIGNHLVKIAPVSNFEPNYQPLANLIETRWFVSEYPERYHYDVTNRTLSITLESDVVGYMRDEVYDFYIRWIYDTGDKTPLYHIPARCVENIQYCGDNMEQTNNASIQQIYNSSTPTSMDGGSVIAEGYVGTYISSEQYDKYNPLRWNFNTFYNSLPNDCDLKKIIIQYPYGITNSSCFDLCGKNIRLHRMPDESISDILKLYDVNNRKIRYVGVKFSNIYHPVDNDGNFIKEIKGFEILRSVRGGNRTILAKGILNGVVEYTDKNGNVVRFERFPGDYDAGNTFRTLTKQKHTISGFVNGSMLFSINNPMSYDNVTSVDLLPNNQAVAYVFHGPETDYEHIYASWSYVKKYGEWYDPAVENMFATDKDLVRYKILSPYGYMVARVVTFGKTLLEMNGRYKIEFGGHVVRKTNTGTGMTEAVGTGTDVIGIVEAALAFAVIGLNTNIQKAYNAVANQNATYAYFIYNMMGNTIGDIFESINNGQDTVMLISAALSGGEFTTPRIIKEEPGILDNLPKPIRIAVFLPLFASLFSSNVLSQIDLFKSGLRYSDVAIIHKNKQLLHHFEKVTSACSMYGVEDSYYLHSGIFKTKNNARLNHLHRTTAVYLELTNGNIFNKIQRDNTHDFINVRKCCNPNTPRQDDVLMKCILPSQAAYNYVGLKVRNERPYSQLYGNRRVSISGAIDIGDQFIRGNRSYNTGYLFGGDTFVTHHSKKDVYLYFVDYLIKSLGAMDGTAFNFLYSMNLAYPRFWLNAQEDGYEIFDPDGYIADNYYCFFSCGNPQAPSYYSQMASYFTGSGSINMILNGLCGETPSLISDLQGFIYEWISGISQGVNELMGFTSSVCESVSDDCSGIGCLFKIFKLLGCIVMLAVSFAVIIVAFIYILGLLISQGILTLLSNFVVFAGKIIQFFKALIITATNTIPEFFKKTYIPYNLESCYVMVSCKKDISIINVIHTFAFYGFIFYLASARAMDFYVESSYNSAFRAHEGNIDFFDAYRNNDISSMFKAIDLKKGDYYSYDPTFLPETYNIIVSVPTELQSYDYDPMVFEHCFRQDHNRLIYSLPENGAPYIDNWRVFLPLNYKVFPNKILGIYPIRDTGGIILFYNQSPLFIQGVDTLRTDNMIAITLGDGGLFNQATRSVSNSELFFEFGSCSDIRSVINSPFGLYYVSNNQGKIYQFAGEALEEVTNKGIREWSNKYLRFALPIQIPTYTYETNNLRGISTLIGYDNKYGILYICKRDYELLPNIKKQVEDGTISISFYDVFINAGFKYYNVFVIKDTSTNSIIDIVGIGRPKFNQYFKDISLTISYDVKSRYFVSFHDWHPDWMIGSYDNLVSVVKGTFYIHNDRCDDYCNFYGKYYPFEIELIHHTGIQPATLRSVEYYMEVYKYGDNCKDFHHVLDYNFDKMILWNSEQISGEVRLQLKDKKNPLLNINYPQYLPNAVVSLYEKVEHKYRVNGFYDLVRDRGEYTGPQPPFIQFEDNGYIRTLDLTQIDYTKPPMQRKRFRHYFNRLWFIKEADLDLTTGNRSFPYRMIVKAVLLKDNISIR